MPPGSLPADRVRAGLALLLEAFKTAKETDQEQWNFAVEFGELREAGLSVNDLRSLLTHGFTRHGLDHVPGAGERRFVQPVNWLTFRPNSCFILTPAGVDFACATGGPLVQPEARENPTPRPASPGDRNGSPTGPKWNAGTRQLAYDGTLIKQFRRPAPLQDQILNGFEAGHWCRRIEVPATILGSGRTKNRLHELINSLNDNHLVRRMHFYSDGTGHGICWQATEPRRPAGSATSRRMTRSRSKSRRRKR